MLLAACTGELEGRSFVAQRVIEDGQERTESLRLEFVDDELFIPDAGCNDLMGRYRVEADVFLADSIGGTKIGCFDSPEDWYIEFLTSSPRLELDGERLVLEGGGTRIDYVEED